MGNFYTSYTLRGPDQKSVAAVLAGRSAIVSPVQENCVVVFDEESEGQSDEVIAELASQLSGELQCPLLAVLNHDDDIFMYWLYLNGELVDEYNSTPGYFEDSDEEAAMAGPSGGDAAKLCAAFGSNEVKLVEDILRRPGLGKDGYAFAFERHEDLLSTLGISSFGAAGFNQVNAGVFPEALEGNDCIWTKDLVATSSADKSSPAPVPGYYKVSFRSVPGLKNSIPIGWAPGTWAELECRKDTLSDSFHKATNGHREKFKKLGFAEVGFKKLKDVLNPNHRDDGGVNFLDDSRRYYGQIIYNRTFFPSLKKEKEKVIIAFTAVFQNAVFSCTNNLQKLVEPLPHHKVVRIESEDVELLYQKFIERLKEYPEPPREFADLPSLQSWYDSNQIGLFEDKVRKKLWIRMSDFEVEAARRKLSRKV